MDHPTKEEIIHQAYELWEQAGKPDKADEFYYQAEFKTKGTFSPLSNLT